MTMSSFDFEAGLFIARAQWHKGVSAKASVERRAARGPEAGGEARFRRRHAR
jgi:hypothetical protein